MVWAQASVRRMSATVGRRRMLKVQSVESPLAVAQPKPPERPAGEVAGRGRRTRLGRAVGEVAKTDGRSWQRGLCS
jgi:hypothetical protein